MMSLPRFTGSQEKNTALVMTQLLGIKKWISHKETSLNTSDYQSEAMDFEDQEDEILTKRKRKARSSWVSLGCMEQMIRLAKNLKLS